MFTLVSKGENLRLSPSYSARAQLGYDIYAERVR